jgi:hypothetical protein
LFKVPLYQLFKKKLMLFEFVDQGGCFFADKGDNVSSSSLFWILFSCKKSHRHLYILLDFASHVNKGGCAAKIAVSRMGSEQRKYAIVAMIAYIIMIICLFIGWMM